MPTRPLTATPLVANGFRLASIALGAAIAVSAPAASAGTGTYTISGLMNGSFNGTRFSREGVTFTLIGPTGNIVTGGGAAFLDPLTSATVALDGIGVYALSDVTKLGGLLGGGETTFDQLEPQTGQPPRLRNLLIWGDASALDLGHSFGPLVSGDFNEVSGDVIPTSGGDLKFDLSEGLLPVLTFSGVVTGGVPEPASWALMLIGFGMAGMVSRRRRVLRS